MTSLRNTVAAAVIACGVGGGVIATAGASASAQPQTAKVQLRVESTKIGKILVTNGGLVVYMFTKDKKNKDNCPASTGCAAQWPPLVGTPVLGPGVKKSLLGTTKVGSKEQITYNGYPLYGYVYGSTSISYVGYVQFGGAWDAISPTGAIVHNKPV